MTFPDHIPSAFFTWTANGALDSTLAELSRYLYKLEDAIYFTYVQRSMTPATLKDLSLAFPEVATRLAKVASILNQEVAHYPRVAGMKKHKPYGAGQALSAAKSDCSAFLSRSIGQGGVVGAKLLQQQALACAESAARVAVLNGKQFLGLQSLPNLKFPPVAGAKLSSFESIGELAGIGSAWAASDQEYPRKSCLNQFLF